MVLPSDYIEGFVCNLTSCDVKIWGYVHYQPSMPGNVLFLIIIDVIALAQLYMGLAYGTGIVCLSMLLGLASESTGYVARILLHGNPFSRLYFLMYLICLTIGPAFLAAAIYVCLGRIVVIYGEHISRIRSRSYTIIFMGFDFVSLVIQAVGGGIAASYPLYDTKMIDLGTHILVAGLAFQVASLFAFSICSLEFLWRVHKNHNLRNLEHADLWESKKFKLFLCALAVATVSLFIRTVFRSVELSEGFTGHLANSEVQFMVLDGVMVIIACISLTVMHPGIGFGNKWKASKFAWAKQKVEANEVRGEASDSPSATEKGMGVTTLSQL